MEYNIISGNYMTDLNDNNINIDSNSLQNTISNYNSDILKDCNTCGTSNENLSASLITEKNKKFEVLINHIQSDIKEKEDKLFNDINDKINVEKSKMDILNASDNALQYSESTHTQSIQLQRYNLETSFQKIEYLQNEVDNKNAVLIRTKNKLTEKKKQYCKQAEELLEYIKKITIEKQELLNTLENSIKLENDEDTDLSDTNLSDTDLSDTDLSDTNLIDTNDIDTNDIDTNNIDTNNIDTNDIDTNGIGY